MSLRFAMMKAVADAAFGVPVAWPGIDFDPPNEGAWIEATLFENDPVDLAIANNGTVLDRGILQLAACGRPGAGFMDLDDLARRIQAAFPKGTKITPLPRDGVVLDLDFTTETYQVLDASKTVKVTRHPWRLGDITTDTKLLIPVSIPYGP